jgi:hypothetical protein
MLLEYKAALHLSAIARLHCKMISYSTITQLGEECIYKCYKALSELDSTFGFVWIDKDFKLIGFALGTTDSKAARKAMFSSIKFSDKLKICLLSIKSMGNLLNIFDTIFFINPFILRNKIKAEWLSWITETSDRRSSLAALETYKAIKKHFAEIGIKQFWCQADKRTKTHKFLSHFKNIQQKKLFQNYIFIINSL